VADHPSTPAGSSSFTPGVLSNFRFDLVAGFLVFLIAMPLCLAIARACGYPPIAGIWTAVIGGVICSLLSNSELTIKGPAAGLIVIVYGAVTELGAEFGAGLSDVDRAMIGYRLALGVGVTAGVIQILLGLVRAGRLADFFPLTPVHGMLASIGLIIIAKQAFEVFGATPEKGAGPLKLFASLPSAFTGMNPEIAIIGLVSLIILFGVPLVRNRWVKRVPAQLIVLVAAVTLGLAFDLEHKHAYLFPDSFFDTNHRAEYEVGPRFLVDMPEVLQDAGAAFALPDFRGVVTPTGIQYVILFCLIGSLESLLSAKAIELLDPWRRKTNFDRDLLAIGVANTICSAVGALPMISEIVRSKANIDNGARTRASNFFHGLFLLGFVLLFPNLIHRIPLAALAAMLVYTGFRLASPREFVRTYKVGSEQFLVFVGTIIATLATDLLIGIAVGICLEVLFHLRHGCPVGGLLRSDVDIVPEGDRMVVVVVKKAAVFSNWLGLRSVSHSLRGSQRDGETASTRRGLRSFRQAPQGDWSGRAHAAVAPSARGPEIEAAAEADGGELSRNSRHAARIERHLPGKDCRSLDRGQPWMGHSRLRCIGENGQSGVSF
jgi:MFS superfamily sulfate permease-like transporter